MEIIIPQRPSLAAVQGAALSAVIPSMASNRSRILRHTYGFLQTITVADAIERGVPRQFIKEMQYKKQQ